MSVMNKICVYSCLGGETNYVKMQKKDRMKVQKRSPVRLKGAKLKALILSVLERDNYTCQGEKCPGKFALDSPHHIIFKSQGGSDTEDNLITLCRYCHGKRHGITYKN